MRKGFTLVEVLTVVAIIGILATLGTYTYTASLTRSRDSQRISDLKIIGNSLEQYYLDNRKYPDFEGDGHKPEATWQLEKLGDGCQIKTAEEYLAPKYLAAIPQDPSYKFSQSNCNSIAKGQYLYFVTPKATSKEGFYLMARVERLINVNYDPAEVVLTDYTNLPPNFCDSSQYSSAPDGCWQNYYLKNARNQ